MSKMLFVVDDEKIIADSLAAILNKCGFNARAFYDAETALSACAEAAPEYVISDVAMPGVSGVELAIQISESFPKCRILLFSGHASTINLLEDARSRGYHFDLLSKPLHPRDLLAKLEKEDSRPPLNLSAPMMV